jgi:hypothetical protein
MPDKLPSAPKVGASAGAGNRGKGRKKGVPNKTTALLKDAILNAFARAGGEDYLLGVAKADYKTFCTLLGRVLPQQHTGAGEGPIHVVSETAGGARDKIRAELARLTQRQAMETPIAPPTSDIAKFKINKEDGVEAKEARRAALAGTNGDFW